MKNRRLLLVCLITLLVSTVASAKSYWVTLTAPTKVGANQLKAGEHEFKLVGTKVTFSEGSKSFTVDVKVQQASKKYDSTAAETMSEGGVDKLQAINLGDSTTRIEFGN